MILNKNPYDEEEYKQAWDKGYVNDISVVNLSNKEIAQAWKEGYKAKEDDLTKIPSGPYCYHGSRAPGDNTYKICPFWELRTIEHGEFKGETFGYCLLIKMGDFSHKENDETTLLLKDQCKECGINNDYEEDED